MELLERAAVTPDPGEKENLARESFNFLSKVPESADLQTVCRRFEDLRSDAFIKWKAIPNVFDYQVLILSMCLKHKIDCLQVL